MPSPEPLVSTSASFSFAFLVFLSSCQWQRRLQLRLAALRGFLALGFRVNCASINRSVSFFARSFKWMKMPPSPNGAGMLPAALASGVYSTTSSCISGGLPSVIPVAELAFVPYGSRFGRHGVFHVRALMY